MLADNETKNGWFNADKFKPYKKQSLDQKYIEYLNIKRHISIKIPFRYLDKIEVIRKIRNCLTHNSGVCDEELEKSLMESYPDLISDHFITLNEKYVEEAFALVGNMFKCVEEGYTGKPYEERSPFEADE